MSGHAPEERFKPDAAENARKARGAASTARSAKHRKEAPPFDWDRALMLFRQGSKKPKKDKRSGEPDGA